MAAASAGIASPSLADSAGSSLTDATGAEPLIPAAGSGGIGSSEITDAVASGIINSTTCTPAAGKETPVLLIHGTTTNSSYMLPTAEALHKRGYCV